MMISPRPPYSLHRLVQPPRLGADLEQPDVGGVVDVQRRRVVAGGVLEDAPPLALVAQTALAQVVALDRRLRRDEALRELRLGHLQAEQGDRLGALGVQRDVLGDVRDQRRLAHRRARREDDQVARLEAAGDLVEVGEARRRARHRDALARELLPLADLVVEDLADLPEVLLAVVVRDLEHRLLGVLDELARRRRRGRGPTAWISYVVGSSRRSKRVLADDRRRSGAAPPTAGTAAASESISPRPPAASSLPRARRCSVDGDHVDRLGLVVEVEHRLEDQAVALAVEVLGAQAVVSRT